MLKRPALPLVKLKLGFLAGFVLNADAKADHVVTERRARERETTERFTVMDRRPIRNMARENIINHNTLTPKRHT